LRFSMRRPTHQALSRYTPTIVLFGALIIAATNSAICAEANGIRSILYLTVKSDANSPFQQQSLDEPQLATLTVKIRLSAHSQETNFYGDVPATVSDFDPTKGSQEQKVWMDAKCHHERGFPKMTVISVEGFLKSGQKKLPIAARYRWIGLLLPGDEVMPSNRLTSGTDDVGPFIATRTETKKSRLLVDLKLYMMPCTLSASAN
jgi:hypothetical protein